MNKYKKFVLEARMRKIKAGGLPAPGFGAPPRAPKSSKKPTNEQLAVWYSRSDKWRKDYLKKRPGSMFQGLATKPNETKILTRSKRLSRSPTAIALTEKSLETLKSWGLKAPKVTKERAHKMIGSAREFLKGNRDKFAEKATENFDKFKSKLSKSDQGEMEREAEELNRSSMKPSKKYSVKAGLKGVLPSLVGYAAAAAIFGGYIPPEAIAFLGVKILDAGWEAIKHVTHESGGVATFIAGTVIKDYMKSKDADEDVERTVNKLEKAHGNPDDEEKDDAKPEVEEAPSKESIKLKDGSKVEFDPEKYEKTPEGNWKRRA